MAIVAGVDFGTLSVRVSIVTACAGCLRRLLLEYALHRSVTIRSMHAIA